MAYVIKFDREDTNPPIVIGIAKTEREAKEYISRSAIYNTEDPDNIGHNLADKLGSVGYHGLQNEEKKAYNATKSKYSIVHVSDIDLSQECYLLIDCENWPIDDNLLTNDREYIKYKIIETDPTGDFENPHPEELNEDLETVISERRVFENQIYESGKSLKACTLYGEGIFINVEDNIPSDD